MFLALLGKQLKPHHTAIKFYSEYLLTSKHLTLNSDFFFFSFYTISCLTKFKEDTLPKYLPITVRKRISWFSKGY